MSYRILLIEDDARLAAMVADYLGEAGFRATIAGSGAEAQRQLRREQFDAIVLDLMLPDTDGLELCRHIRAESNIPLLMLTARGDPLDRVVGLELGADDYLPKPFEQRELLARLRAILRRHHAAAATTDVLRFGRLEIDCGARQVRVDGQEKPLTNMMLRTVGVPVPAGRSVTSEDDAWDAAQAVGLPVELFPDATPRSPNGSPPS